MAHAPITLQKRHLRENLSYGRILTLDDLLDSLIMTTTTKRACTIWFVLYIATGHRQTAELLVSGHLLTIFLESLK